VRADAGTILDKGAYMGFLVNSGMHLSLINCSDADFREFVEPLALATKLSYTATYGSYSNESEWNATIPGGWVRDLARTADPPGGGMRALLFTQPDSGRAIVAFRGTDLNVSGISGQADSCADSSLFDPDAPLPAYCSKFSNATLDYWARATEYVADARAAYPQLSFLFTGHSLGAALASTMAAASPASAPLAPAVVFSSPDYVSPLRRRAPQQLPLPARAHGRMYALADAWDPVEHGAIVAGGLRGERCLWTSQPPPACCKTCFAHFDERSAACVDCLYQRHIYAWYLSTLVPGPRPSCTNASTD
jgi:hypothetical protein